MRNVVKRDGATSSTTKSDVAVPDKAPIPGGASGQPDDPFGDRNAPSTKIHGLADIAPARAELKVSRPARRFQVVGGPESVMWEGGRVRMNHGKIYPETATDIEFLRKQGVIFQELVDEPVQTEAAPSEV
jgi:hypothetical protein